MRLHRSREDDESRLGADTSQHRDCEIKIAAGFVRPFAAIGATLARATMLRTSANALWSRFVPAARQHIAGAGAASASRVRLHARPMRGRAFPTARQAPVFAGHTRFGAHSLRCRARTNLSSPTHPQRSFVSSPIAREEDEYEIDEHAVRLIPLVPNPPSVARLPTAPYTTDRASTRCVREALRQSPTTDATLVVRFRFRLQT